MLYWLLNGILVQLMKQITHWWWDWLRYSSSLNMPNPKILWAVNNSEEIKVYYKIIEK